MHNISHTLLLTALGDSEIRHLSEPSLPTVTEDSKWSFYLRTYWEVEWWGRGCLAQKDWRKHLAFWCYGSGKSASAFLSPHPRLWNLVNNTFTVMTGEEQIWRCFVNFTLCIIVLEALKSVLMNGTVEGKRSTRKEFLYHKVKGTLIHWRIGQYLW